MSEARTYHHGRLREALVEAGVAQAREGGADAVVLRDAARRVGVSHNAAYRHFADRDALLRSIAAQGLDLLVAAMQRRLGEVVETGEPGRARARLRATGRGYVDFAMAEPGLFAVVFRAYPEGKDDVAHEVGDPLGVLSAALDDLAAVGWLHPDRRAGAESLCWSAVHGFAVLHLEGPLAGTDPAQRDAELARVLDTLEVGLAAGDPAEPAVPAGPTG